MTDYDLTAENTRRTRDNLLRIRDACVADRYAFFPAMARDLAGFAQLRVVLFGTQGIEFPAQYEAVARAVALHGGRIEAVVADVGESAQAEYLSARQCRVVTVHDFFANASTYKDCVVVDRTSTWYPGVRYKVRLRQAGLPFLRLEQFLNAPGFEAAGGTYRAHGDEMLARFDEFLAVEKYWSDAMSLQTYYYALAAFISMNYQYFAFHCGDHAQRYFAPGTGLHFDDTTLFADCGAHDGQEVLIFTELTGGHFKAVHAFEPDHRNFLKLSDCMTRYTASHGARPIYCHELGVYDRNAFLPVQGAGTLVSVVSVVDNADTAPAAAAAVDTGIHVCRLDDVLDELGHLRLEIEGAELAALHGARQLLQRDRPSMTVSAYHRADDFLKLPRFIDELGLGYRMSLRHQSLEASVLCIYAVQP